MSPTLVLRQTDRAVLWINDKEADCNNCRHTGGDDGRGDSTTAWRHTRGGAACRHTTAQRRHIHRRRYTRINESHRPTDQNCPFPPRLFHYTQNIDPVISVHQSATSLACTLSKHLLYGHTHTHTHTSNNPRLLLTVDACATGTFIVFCRISYRITLVCVCIEPEHFNTITETANTASSGYTDIKLICRNCSINFVKSTDKLADTLRGSRSGVQSASLIMASLMTS